MRAERVSARAMAQSGPIRTLREDIMSHDLASLRATYRRAYAYAVECDDDPLTAGAFANYFLRHEAEYGHDGRIVYAPAAINAYERFWKSQDGADCRVWQGARCERWAA